MPETGDAILLSIDDDGTAGSVGMVITCHDNGWTAEFEIEEFKPVVGREAVLRFEDHAGFGRQPVRIDTVECIGHTTTVRVTPTDELDSAENRIHPRYPTVNSSAVMTFGGEAGCPMLDVSIGGLSVMSGEKHAVGETVAVTLEHDGKIVTWPVIVRSIREVWEGRFRYGLECEHAEVDPTALLDRLGAALE